MVQIKEKTKNKQRFSQQVLVMLVLGAVVLLVIAINFISSATMREKVSIVVLKSSISQDGVLASTNFQQGQMSKDDYEKQGIVTLNDGSKRRAIVLWSDKDKIANTYAGNYIRSGVSIFWDELTNQTPKKTAYLYSMQGELMKLDIDASQFGELIVPGDRINVRVSYKDNNYKLPTEQDYLAGQMTGAGTATSIQRSEKLVNEARVLDILNSDGQSIFDIYYDLMGLTKADQEKKMEDDTFKKSIQPKQFLLDVTSEEADRYMKIKSSSPTYMLTLLPRSGSNLILDTLSELQKK